MQAWLGGLYTQPPIPAGILQIMNFQSDDDMLEILTDFSKHLTLLQYLSAYCDRLTVNMSVILEHKYRQSHLFTFTFYYPLTIFTMLFSFT